ncbi:CHRD domain-containing protein [Variovorax boronicumulans]|uniref:CHRD domain-containing protein n=1 Tax=Variovorax boronicumulans TaxID=436515 RepID=UPI001C563CF9
MLEPVRRTLRRRTVLCAAALSALAASGCALVSGIGSSDKAVAVPRDPPEWVTIDCWIGTEEVVPRRTGNAGGSMFGTLTLATGEFTWRVNYARLSGPATLAGFYGPAAKGRNGPLAVQLPPHGQAEQRGTDADAGYELTGRSRLTQAQVADLLAGLWYVSVSTRAWPGGEVRGQLKRSTAGVHGV